MHVTDPVCGRRVDIDKTVQEQHGGWVYFFCSADCRRRFAEDPNRYTGREQKRMVSVQDKDGPT